MYYNKFNFWKYYPKLLELKENGVKMEVVYFLRTKSKGLLSTKKSVLRMRHEIGRTEYTRRVSL